MATSLPGQRQNPPPRITASEIQALLRSDPTLSSGFISPNGVTVKVVKVVDGGVIIQFHLNNVAHGELTVQGPPSVINKGGLFGWADWVIDAVNKLQGKEPTAGSSCTVTVTVIGNNNNTAVGGNSGCGAQPQ
jgi:hypothetical protein